MWSPLLSDPVPDGTVVHHGFDLILGEPEVEQVVADEVAVAELKAARVV